MTDLEMVPFISSLASRLRNDSPFRLISERRTLATRVKERLSPSQFAPFSPVNPCESVSFRGLAPFPLFLISSQSPCNLTSRPCGGRFSCRERLDQLLQHKG